jgi:Pyridine nucleotide-disulphide oxidoreductase
VDGIDELLLRFANRPGRPLPAVETTRSMVVRAKDEPRSWRVTFAPSGFQIEADPIDDDAELLVTGDASELYVLYAARLDLPVRNGVRVDRLIRNGGRFELSARERRFEADNVVVAMATHLVPWVPSFARELDPRVAQLHAADYRNPSQLRDSDPLVVGVGNSGA